MLVSIDDANPHTLYYVSVVAWIDGTAEVVDAEGQFLSAGKHKGKMLTTSREEAHSYKFPKSIVNRYCTVVGVERGEGYDDWSVVSVEQVDETPS